MFSDSVSERAILAGICQYGSSAYLDVADIVQETTFTDESASLIFRCVKRILEKDDAAKIDIPTIHSASHELGFSHILVKKDEVRYLQALFNFPVDLSNVRKFAAKARKLEIAKLMHKQLSVAQDKMMDIKGDESIAQILGIAEDAIFDFTALLNDQENSPEKLGQGIHEYLDYLENNPVDQIGISTGFPAYDQAIGGGLRPATINIIAARPKIGKTILTDNIGYHIAGKLGLPVLNMDTEMTKEDHMNRTLAMLSEVPINDIETGKFGTNTYNRQKVRDSASKMENIPYDYKSIAGKPFEEQLALMRRWLMKEVGLNEDGTAKPCVIIYDYLKLMDTQGVSQSMQEFQLLGFMMSSLHNFATRYKVPILALMQLNRDGITKESTDVASGSDRIIWLCSNFTLFKGKSDEEIAEDGVEAGNRKLVPLVARHGEGLDYRDYINCHMKGWCAKITEGKTKLELSQEDPEDGFIVDDNDGERPAQFGHE